MTAEQFAAMTMPQLLAVFEQYARDAEANGRRKLAPAEVAARQRTAQDRVFDRVCERNRWRPERLAALPPPVLAECVGREVDGGRIGDLAKLAELAVDYARRRRDGDGGATAGTRRERSAA